jgi:aminoglycoside 2'-N-acetyltransferase I
LRALLFGAFDDGFTEADWHHTVGGWRAVAMDDGVPVSHAAVVPRTIEVAGHSFAAGYVEGVATARARRGSGLGAAVLDAVNAVIVGSFELGVLSTDRWSFYERAGWQRWHGPSYAKDGGTLVRTVDEDDGLMVLRIGPSAAVDLSAPIACRCRVGDDW